MVALGIGKRLWRYLAGGSISLLGGGLLGVPLLDIWDDTTNLSWNVLTTVVENGLFVVLAAVLVAGGVWLVRTDWETARVTRTARRTLVGTGVVALLIGWAGYLQLSVMGGLKPTFLALDGVLVGSVTAFGLSVTSVRSEALSERTDRHEATNERLELLYEAAVDLEGARTHEEAYDVVEEAVAAVVGEAPFRVVVDDEPVVEHGTGTDDAAPVERISIGGEGYVALYDEFDANVVVTVELFASFLEETLRRLGHESELREERDALEFINRTLRHDLMGDLSLVQARLRMLDREAELSDGDDEHLDIALDRVDEMETFVRTMRAYMQSKVASDHTLEPVPLAPLLDEHVESVRQAHPDAEIHHGDVPSVEVVGDDLLDRVFVNLLSNAVEHNDAETPRIEVDAERDGSTATVSIADNGPGIPDELVASLFERGESGGETAGGGFGLYLVDDVVDGYGGEVHVGENEPRGTVFEVELPLAEGDDASAER